MNRSTKNGTIPGTKRVGVLGESRETVTGSLDGVVAVATTSLTEKQFLAANPANTYSPVPSSNHNP